MRAFNQPRKKKKYDWRKTYVLCASFRFLFKDATILAMYIGGINDNNANVCLKVDRLVFFLFTNRLFFDGQLLKGKLHSFLFTKSLCLHIS